MRQIGVCLASCPNGFYGTRSPDRNDCISKTHALSQHLLEIFTLQSTLSLSYGSKVTDVDVSAAAFSSRPMRCRNKCASCFSECGSECDSCFNRNFCLRCRAGSYLHKGKCMESCPDGLVPSDTKKECVTGEWHHLLFTTIQIWFSVHIFRPNPDSLINIWCIRICCYSNDKGQHYALRFVVANATKFAFINNIWHWFYSVSSGLWLMPEQWHMYTVCPGTLPPAWTMSSHLPRGVRAQRPEYGVHPHRLVTIILKRSKSRIVWRAFSDSCCCFSALWSWRLEWVGSLFTLRKNLRLQMGRRDTDTEGLTKPHTWRDPVPPGFWKEGMLCQKKKM